MTPTRPRFPDERDPHVATRTLVGMAVALAVAVGVVHWPARPSEPEPVVYSDREPLPVQLVEIPQTTMPPPPANLAPPPPPPSVDLDIPPVEVEDFIEVEDLEVAPFEVRQPARQPSAPGPPRPPVGPPSAGPPGASPSPAPAEESGPQLVRNPDTPPRNRFMRLPVYPDEARRAGVKGRMIAEILVSEGGRAESVEVLERVLIRGDREERVPRLPYGMEESLMDALQRRTYTSARHGGRIVRTYKRESITVGVE